MVGQAGVSLKVPFYYGGAIDARVDEVSSARNANEAGFYELKVQVEEDVRLALKKLAAAAERVGAVEETVALAENELVMARDRFAAGVGDNLELTNSQTVLSRARDSYVNALAGYHVLRVNLALARGKMRGFKF